MRKLALITNGRGSSTSLTVEDESARFHSYNITNKPMSVVKTSTGEDAAEGFAEEFRESVIEAIFQASYDRKPVIYIEYNGYSNLGRVQETIDELLSLGKQKVKEKRGIDNFRIEVNVSISYHRLS